MKRTLILLAVMVVGFATSANAASLTLVSDKSTYNIGENIVITLSGQSAGESAVFAFARLEWSETALTTTVSREEISHQIGAMAGSRTIQGPDNMGDGFVHMIDQLISGGSSGTVNPGFNCVSPASGGTTATCPAGTIATVTLLADGAGVVNVDFFVKSGDSLGLSYFGITNQAGISFLIVPEPTTAALVGLGLVGLVLGGRRRS